MNKFLLLYYEFFKTGLFSIGGGMATLPFLKAMGEKTGWFTYSELMDMLAISESTPGPIGINMATYAGFRAAGLPGAIIATLGEITPSIIIILIIATILNKFKTNKYVANAFYGLRPASSALIGSALLGVFYEVICHSDFSAPLNYKGIILGLVLYFATNKVKVIKDLHPIVLILFSAVCGIVFKFT